MSQEELQAFPLTWPAGRPRALQRLRARFNVKSQDSYGRYRDSELTISVALKQVREELRKLGAEDVVISTNVEVRRDGMPYSTTREPVDPGVAIYIRLDGTAHCLPCDKWDRVADNMAAIARHIEAIRGQSRWGVGDLAQAFAGYRALPAMGASKPWWEILTFKDPPFKLETVEKKWQELIGRHHPDRGGNGNQAAEINAAMGEAKQFYQRSAR